jgi:DNA-binding transcriptional LysR family regulator
VRAARDAVDEVRGGLRGTVRIGILTAVTIVDVPSVLGAFHRSHPEVTLQLTTSPRGSVGLVESLLDGSLDLALVSVPGRTPAGVRIWTTHREPLLLILPEGHRLADRAEVGVPDLAGEAFVDFPEGYGNRAVVDRAFAAAGVQRQVAVQVMDITSGASYVREGLGVAILPPFAVPDRRGLVVRPLAGSDLEWPLGLAVSALRPPSAAARALLELFQKSIG